MINPLTILGYCIGGIILLVVVLAFAIIIDIPGSICRAIDRYYESKEGE